MPSSPATIEGGICSRSDLPPGMCWHCRGHEHLQVPDLSDLGAPADTAPSDLALTHRTVITARHSTWCRTCRAPIERGELIIGGDEGWVHDTCAPGGP